MSGATMWRVGNIVEFLRALSEAMATPNEIGRAEDSRLAQPPRIIWEPVRDSWQIRECANRSGYAGLKVYYEDSLAYFVHLRGLDVEACNDARASFVYALIQNSWWFNAVIPEAGSLDPQSVAAEQGAHLVIRIRVWTPIVHANLLAGHIETSTTGVIVIDASGNIGGRVP